MSPSPDPNRCEQSEVTCAYALQALPADEVAAADAHIASCPNCQRELESLRPVVDRFVAWHTDVLRPTSSLQGRLALRTAEKIGKQPPPARRWSEPEWEQVAPGIECKLLATDTERHRVSMLVRLAPGANYPAHTHAGVEELHLLNGELWVDERKLVPGDYSYGAPGADDQRVETGTGCTCVLVTSTQDVLRSADERSRAGAPRHVRGSGLDGQVFAVAQFLGFESKSRPIETIGNSKETAMAAITPFLQGDAFEPDAIRVMSIALEEVCRTLQVDGDQRAREVMAVRIVELARRGERDPDRLRDRVLREAGAAPSVVPPDPVKGDAD